MRSHSHSISDYDLSHLPVFMSLTNSPHVLLLLTSHLHNAFSIFPDCSSFCSTLFPLILFLLLCVIFFVGETNVQMSKNAALPQRLEEPQGKMALSILTFALLRHFWATLLTHVTDKRLSKFFTVELILLCESRRV